MNGGCQVASKPVSRLSCSSRWAGACRAISTGTGCPSVTTTSSRVKSTSSQVPSFSFWFKQMLLNRAYFNCFYALLFFSVNYLPDQPTVFLPYCLSGGG